MQYTEIGPNGSPAEWLLALERRVQSLESSPSGNIVIRQTLSTTDPTTGVSTILGQLPDGSYGILPYVNDVTPPPVATTPLVSAEPGVFIIRWDGSFVGGEASPADFQRVNVLAYKVVNSVSSPSVLVGSIPISSNNVQVTSDVALPGETWVFTLQSEDYNGNLAAESASSPLMTMRSVADADGVGDAIAAVQADADAAKSAADAAQTTANSAQTAANQASADAASAAGIANGKGKVLVQTTAPGTADQNANTLWIDSTGGANTPKRWDSGTSQWVAVTDKTATDAAAAAAAAQTKADQAFNNAASAATAAGNAQTTADGKNRVWYQTSPPAGTGNKTGDTWFDTDDGNRVYVWNGTAWTDARDTGIAAADSKAQTALTSANGKNKVYYQTAMPTGGTYILGDTWFDTDDGNKIYVYNGTTFSATPLGTNAIANLAITNAQIADSTIQAAKIGSVDAGTITVGKLTGGQIAAGAITTTHMTSGTIDAGVLTAGSITAPKIGAKAITVDKLVITSTDNLIVGADFSNGAASWQLGANVTYQATASRGGTSALRVTGTTATQTSTNLSNRVTVEPDNRFRCSIFVKSSAALAADKIRLMLRCYTTATAYTDIVGINNAVALIPAAWTQLKGISPALPANTIAVEFYLSVTNDATGTVTDIDYVSTTRAADGNLVLDGAMDAKSITGATIQTAVSGARIVLDQSSLNAWNTTNDNYFSVNATTGVNISMVGQYGYDVTRVNACVNPSFEADISGWSSSQTIAQDTTTAYSGSASLKATHTATADRVVYRNQSQNPNPFGTAYFSAYVKHNSTVSKSVKADFSWTDASDVALANETYSSTYTVPPNTWTRVSVVTSSNGSPIASSKMRMTVTGVAFASTETLWIDAVLLDNVYGTTPRSYFDGDTVGSGKVSYAWNDTSATGTFSEERTQRDVKIKTGSNAVLKDPTSTKDGGIQVIEYIQSPGVGFVLPQPLNQTAGLFSDGTVVSLIEGTNSGGRVARVAVGNGQINTYSGGISTYKSYGTMNIQSQNSSVFISGSAVNLNGVDMKTRRAEFNNSGSFSVNAGALWDIGALTIDTNTKKTVNNSFVNPSSTPGAVTILEEGYYMFFVIVIPNSNPGPAWLRLYRSSDNERLFQVNNGNAYAYETSGTSGPVYISQNDTVRTMYQATNAHTINAKLKIVKLNYG